MNSSNLIVQQSTVLFLLREGMCKTAQNICSQQFKTTQDPFFQFWKAFTFFKEGSLNEAINELSLIQNKREFAYATGSALIYYHQLQRGVDRETMEQFKQLQNQGRQMPNDKSTTAAVYFYTFVDEPKKAKESCDLLQISQPNSQVTLGWYQLMSPEDREPQRTFEFWQKIGAEIQGQKSLEHLLGLVKVGMINKKYQISLEAINEIVFVYPSFPFGLVEKSKILMLIADFDQSLEIAEKLVQQQPDSILALRVLAFHRIAREGNLSDGCERLEALVREIEQQEDKNIQLILHISQLFSRVAGRNSKILAITLSLLQKGRKISPLSAELCLEMAQQTLMLDEYEKAYALFQEAAALDEGKVESLAGMIQTRILQGIIDDAEKQLEFVTEIQVSVGRTVEIAFLEALLESKKNQGKEDEGTMKLIDEALRLHIAQSKLAPPGFENYVKLNPDFLIIISQLYLRNLSTNNMLDGKESSQSAVAKGTKLLETVTKQIPGLTNAYLLMATGKMALGDQAEALRSINKVLEQDNTNEDAYILHALISLKTGAFDAAATSLSQAISNNFMIRENPLFMLVKGEIEYRTEKYQECMKTMELAFEIPGVKEALNPRLIKKGLQKPQKQVSKILQFTAKERVSIFVLYAKSLAKNKKEKEAKSVMQKAIQEFAGTSEEGAVMLANSEIAIESGDVKKAINILKAVAIGQPTFIQSRILLADIYLNSLKDTRNYTKCYLELIEAEKTYENFKLMGDALMKIYEPEDAAKAYEEALKLKPDDDQIIRQLGAALTKTYDYNRAIQYYDQALRKNSKRNDLCVDLGQLYLQIGDLQKAEEVLQWDKFVKDDFTAPTVDILKQNAEGFLLITKLLQKKSAAFLAQAQQLDNQKQQQQKVDESNKCLEKVKMAFTNSLSSQKDAIQKVKMEGGKVQEERDRLGELYFEFAKYYYNVEKNFKNALQALEEALKILPTSQKILQLQIEILNKLGDGVGCEQKLKMLLNLNPKNDFANVLMADMMSQKDDSERVIEKFKQMLQEKPDSYGTLARLVDWHRRQNRLQDAKAFIDRSTESTQNPNEPGLAFCRGLFYKWSLKPKEALAEFNIAKRNLQYAEDSITHMIEIYLSPELDLYYTLIEEQAKQIDPENLRGCEMLLKELSVRGSLQRYTIMQAYVLMLQAKPQLDLAVSQLTQLLKQYQEYIPALLALAIAKFIGKKQNDGKNLLKILWKKPILANAWESEELERAWLLHADGFIAIQKYDNAEEILRKCLQYNKACGKAEEYMGLIKEKEQSYVDAANHYENAFKLLNRRNLNMGYRLAFNYLKANRNVDALNICKLILDINPNFPKIKKEIQEKAILALK